MAVQNQDNREHDIFDSDDYFQFHGGMIAAIRSLTGENPAAYFGDTANPDHVRVRDLADEARRVFRSRVVNPKWIASVMRHGYKGAFEMAATVDYLFGYEATAGVIDDWMFEDLSKAYLLDPEVQDVPPGEEPLGPPLDGRTPARSRRPRPLGAAGAGDRRGPESHLPAERELAGKPLILH